MSCNFARLEVPSTEQTSKILGMWIMICLLYPPYSNPLALHDAFQLPGKHGPSGTVQAGKKDERFATCYVK